MNYKILTLAVLTIVNTACSDQAFKAEKKLPAYDESCGGAAVKSRYIVRYYDGHFGVYENQTRESMKNNIVIPQLDNIDFIEYDQRVHFHEKIRPTDSTANLEWGTAPAVVENWGPREIGAPSFWSQNLRGQDVIVAVVDSGVDTTHPQLKNQIAYNMGESGDDSQGRDRSTNGIDDDHNGYVDDYLGYDFVSKSGQMVDREGHGTHVSGIIAAEHNDTEIQTGYIQGVAPMAKILPVKFLDTDGGFLSDAMLSIDYAVKRGAKVINASWGGTGCSQTLRQKVSDLAAKDVLFVAAAGNSGANIDIYPEYPAAFDLPMQITVGAIGETLYPASYSNYSLNLVHIFAPGSNIVSTIPGGKAPMDGTSMATPFISGAAALLISAAPQKSLQQIRDQLLRSVIQDSVYLAASQGRIYLPKALENP